MPEKERIILEPTEKDQILIKDGKKFRLLKDVCENGHIKEIIFEEIDEAEYEAKLDKISAYLVDKSNLDAKTIIKDVLRQSSTKFLNAVEKEIEKESPVEIVPGCLSIKIGRKKIEIVE